MTVKPKSAAWAIVLEVALLTLFAGFAAFSQWSKREAQAALLGAQSGFDEMRNEVLRLREALAQMACAEASRAGSLSSVSTVPAGPRISGKGCLLSDGSRLWLFVAYASPGVVSGLVFGVDSPAPRVFDDHLEVTFAGQSPLRVPYEGSLLRTVTPTGLVSLTTKNSADIKGAAERIVAGFFTMEATLLDLCGAPDLEAVLGK
jgi:hypothetical protein